MRSMYLYKSCEVDFLADEFHICTVYLYIIVKFYAYISLRSEHMFVTNYSNRKGKARLPLTAVFLKFKQKEIFSTIQKKIVEKTNVHILKTYHRFQKYLCSTRSISLHEPSIGQKISVGNCYESSFRQ